MSKFESSIKQIPYAQESVYEKLSDLSNMKAVCDKLPAETLKDLSFDTDSISVHVDMVGTIALQIVDREAPKCVKFRTVQSPVPFNLWIQMLPTEPGNSKMKVTLDAELNPFIKSVVSKPLQDGLERMAEALAMIKYE